MSHEPTVQDQLQDLIAGRAPAGEARARLQARLAALDDETVAALDALDPADLAVALAGGGAPGRADAGGVLGAVPGAASLDAAEASTSADRRPFVSGRGEPPEGARGRWPTPEYARPSAVQDPASAESGVGSAPSLGPARRAAGRAPASLAAARARRWRAAVAVASLAAAALALVTLVPAVRAPRQPDARWTGIKGGSALQTALFARLGEHDGGRPVAGAAVVSGAKVARDAAVLFRYRLSAPAWVYLVARGDGGPSLLFAPGRRAAGAHEVASGGRVLALRPGELGTTVQVTLWACPTAVDEHAVLAGGCAGGAHSGLLLRVEGAR